MRPEISQHKWLMENVRNMPPVRFSYNGQPVDIRGDPAGFMEFRVRKWAHVVTYGVLGFFWLAALGASGLKGARRWMLAVMVLLVVVEVKH